MLAPARPVRRCGVVGRREAWASTCRAAPGASRPTANQSRYITVCLLQGALSPAHMVLVGITSRSPADVGYDPGGSG